MAITAAQILSLGINEGVERQNLEGIYIYIPPGPGVGHLCLGMRGSQVRTFHKENATRASFTHQPACSRFF